jgi:hypothetical protein
MCAQEAQEGCDIARRGDLNVFVVTRKCFCQACSALAHAKTGELLRSAPLRLPLPYL